MEVKKMELRIEKLEAVAALDIFYDIGYAIGAAIHDALHIFF